MKISIMPGSVKPPSLGSTNTKTMTAKQELAEYKAQQELAELTEANKTQQYMDNIAANLSSMMASQEYQGMGLGQFETTMKDRLAELEADPTVPAGAKPLLMMTANQLVSDEAKRRKTLLEKDAGAVRSFKPVRVAEGAYRGVTKGLARTAAGIENAIDLASSGAILGHSDTIRGAKDRLGEIAADLPPTAATGQVGSLTRNKVVFADGRAQYEVDQLLEHYSLSPAARKMMKDVGSGLADPSKLMHMTSEEYIDAVAGYVDHERLNYMKAVETRSKWEARAESISPDETALAKDAAKTHAYLRDKGELSIVDLWHAPEVLGETIGDVGADIAIMTLGQAARVALPGGGEAINLAMQTAVATGQYGALQQELMDQVMALDDVDVLARPWVKDLAAFMRDSNPEITDAEIAKEAKYMMAAEAADNGKIGNIVLAATSLAGPQHAVSKRVGGAIGNKLARVPGAQAIAKGSQHFGVRAAKSVLGNAAIEGAQSYAEAAYRDMLVEDVSGIAQNPNAKIYDAKMGFFMGALFGSTTIKGRPDSPKRDATEEPPAKIAEIRQEAQSADPFVAASRILENTSDYTSMRELTEATQDVVLAFDNNLRARDAAEDALTRAKEDGATPDELAQLQADYEQASAAVEIRRGVVEKAERRLGARQKGLTGVQRGNTDDALRDIFGIRAEANESSATKAGRLQSAIDENTAIINNVKQEISGVEAALKQDSQNPDLVERLNKLQDELYVREQMNEDGTHAITQLTADLDRSRQVKEAVKTRLGDDGSLYNADILYASRVKQDTQRVANEIAAMEAEAETTGTDLSLNKTYLDKKAQLAELTQNNYDGSTTYDRYNAIFEGVTNGTERATTGSDQPANRDGARPIGFDTATFAGREGLGPFAGADPQGRGLTDGGPIQLREAGRSNSRYSQATPWGDGAAYRGVTDARLLSREGIEYSLGTGESKGGGRGLYAVPSVSGTVLMQSRNVRHHEYQLDGALALEELTTDPVVQDAAADIAAKHAKALMAQGYEQYDADGNLTVTAGNVSVPAIRSWADGTEGGGQGRAIMRSALATNDSRRIDEAYAIVSMGEPTLPATGMEIPSNLVPAVEAALGRLPVDLRETLTSAVAQMQETSGDVLDPATALLTILVGARHGQYGLADKLMAADSSFNRVLSDLHLSEVEGALPNTDWNSVAISGNDRVGYAAIRFATPVKDIAEAAAVADKALAQARLGIRSDLALPEQVAGFAVKARLFQLPMEREGIAKELRKLPTAVRQRLLAAAKEDNPDINTQRAAMDHIANVIATVRDPDASLPEIQRVSEGNLELYTDWAVSRMVGGEYAAVQKHIKGNMDPATIAALDAQAPKIAKAAADQGINLVVADASDILMHYAASQATSPAFVDPVVFAESVHADAAKLLRLGLTEEASNLEAMATGIETNVMTGDEFTAGVVSRVVSRSVDTTLEQVIQGATWGDFADAVAKIDQIEARNREVSYLNDVIDALAEGKEPPARPEAPTGDSDTNGILTRVENLKDVAIVEPKKTKAKTIERLDTAMRRKIVEIQDLTDAHEDAMLDAVLDPGNGELKQAVDAALAKVDDAYEQLYTLEAQHTAAGLRDLSVEHTITAAQSRIEFTEGNIAQQQAIIDEPTSLAQAKYKANRQVKRLTMHLDALHAVKDAAERVLGMEVVDPTSLDVPALRTQAKNIKDSVTALDADVAAIKENTTVDTPADSDAVALAAYDYTLTPNSKDAIQKVMTDETVGAANAVKVTEADATGLVDTTPEQSAVSPESTSLETAVGVMKDAAAGKDTALDSNPIVEMRKAISGGMVQPHGEQLVGFVDAIGLKDLTDSVSEYAESIGIKDKNYTRESMGNMLSAMYTIHMRDKMGMPLPEGKAMGVKAKAVMTRLETWSLPPNVEFYEALLSQIPANTLEQIHTATADARGDFDLLEPMSLSDYLHQYAQALRAGATGKRVPSVYRVKTDRVMTSLLNRLVFDKVVSPAYRAATEASASVRDEAFTTFRSTVDMIPASWDINSVQDFIYAAMTGGEGANGVRFAQGQPKVANRGKMDVEVTAVIDGKRESVSLEEYAAAEKAGKDVSNPVVRLSKAFSNMIDVIKKSALGIFAGVTLMFASPVTDKVHAGQIYEVPQATRHLELSDEANLVAGMAKRDTVGSFVILDDANGVAHIMNRDGSVNRSEPFVNADPATTNTRPGSVLLTEKPLPTADLDGAQYTAQGMYATVQRLRTDKSGKGLDLGTMPADFNGAVYSLPRKNSPDAVVPLSVMHEAYPKVKDFTDAADPGWPNGSHARGEFDIDNALDTDTALLNPVEGVVDNGLGPGGASMAFLPLLGAGMYRKRKRNKRIVNGVDGKPVEGAAAADSTATFANADTANRSTPEAVERIEYAYERDPYSAYEIDARVGRHASEELAPNTMRGTVMSWWNNVKHSAKEALVAEDAPLSLGWARVLGANPANADQTPIMKEWRRALANKVNYSDEIQANIMEPMHNVIGTIALQEGIDPGEFLKIVGDYTTALHAYTEGNAAIRKELEITANRGREGASLMDRMMGIMMEVEAGNRTQENIIALDVLARSGYFKESPHKLKLADVEKAYQQQLNVEKAAMRQLKKMDEIHAAEQHGIALSDTMYRGARFAAGLTNGDAMKIISKYEAMVPVARLREGVEALVEANQKLDQFKIDKGTMDINEYTRMKQHYDFKYYVPMYKKESLADGDAFDSNGTLANDLEFVRKGQTRGSMDALNAFNATYERAKSIANGAAYDGVRRLLPEVEKVSLANKDADLIFTSVGPESSVPNGNKGYMTGIDGRKYFFRNTNGKVGAEDINATVLAMNRLAYDPNGKMAKAREILNKATRIRAKMFTVWNPIFPVRNAINDIVERDYHMASRTFVDSDGNSINGRQLMRNFRKYATAGFLGRTPLVKSAMSERMTEAIAELKLHGGYVNFSARIAPDLKNNVIQFEQMFDKGARGKVRKALKGIDQRMTKWNERYNEIAPAAAYLAFLDGGMNKPDAAAATLDLMNFTTKGKLANTWYGQSIAFLNAAFQSAYQTKRSLSTKRGRVTAAARAGLMYLAVQSLKAIAQGDGEDEENPFDLMSVTEIARGAPLFYGDEGQFLRIPTGFGMPRILLGAAVVADRLSSGLMNSNEAVSELALLASSELTPFDLGDFKEMGVLHQVVAAATPTVGEPVMQWITGRTGFGNSITPDGDMWKSDHLNDFVNTEDFYLDVARQIHDATGGLANVNPETIKFISNELAQGPFRAITEWISRQSAYRSNKEWETDSVLLGATLKGLGLSSMQNRVNVTDKMYYKQMDDIAKLIQQKGISLSNGSLTGDKAMAWRKTEMIKAGFTPQQMAMAELMRKSINDMKKVSPEIRVVRDQYLDGTISKDMAAMQIAPLLKELIRIKEHATNKAVLMEYY